MPAKVQLIFTPHRLLALFAAIATLTGCAVESRMAPLKNTFLENRDINVKTDNIPLLHAWVNEKSDISKNTTLFIKPVRTDLLAPDEWKNSRSTYIATEEGFNLEAKEIATYFRNQLFEKIRVPGSRWNLVDTVTPSTLILEVALTELQLSHPAVRAAALAVPVPGAGAAVGAFTDPHAAFAARLTDAKGTLIATGADRRFPPSRLVDLNKITATSSVREICSIWAAIIAEALNKGISEKIEDRGNVSLLPW